MCVRETENFCTEGSLVQKKKLIKKTRKTVVVHAMRREDVRTRPEHVYPRQTLKHGIL